MGLPLVTLSLPTIGRLEFLPALKDALASQTFRDFELLLIDNACPSESRAALAEWARADERVRHLAIDERVPMFANFNRGFREARGTYFVTLNDDDLYAPTFLERMLAEIEASRDIGFVGCNFDFIDETGTITEERRWIRATGRRPGRDYIRMMMRTARNPVPIAGTMFRRAAMDPRGFDEALSPHYGDFIVMMRVAERHDVAFVADALVQVRRHAAQESVRCDHALGFKLLAEQFGAYIEELRANWPGDAAFLADVERGYRRSNRIVSLWGWLNAPDDASALECLAALREGPVNGALGAVLARAGDVGLGAERRKAVVPLMRKVGNALRHR